MLPVAFVVWMTSLAVHQAFNLFMGSDAPDVLSLAVLLLAILVACCIAYASSRAALTVLIVAVCLCGISTLSVALAQWHDPATRAARRTAETAVIATMRIITPPTASTLRDADCQTDAVLRSLSDGSVTQSSLASLRLFASGTACAQLAHGSVIRIHGVLQQARYGKQPLWLITEPSSGMPETIRAPTLPRRTITVIQQSFFSVTERLSDQGRVLVPGLTLGMLGQDHVNIGDGVYDRQRHAQSPVEEAYAELVEDNFRRSGIMHLMAVSGGHFMLVADLTRRLCARLLMPRRLVAGLVAASYLLLAAAMYPSDSVLRALVMGLLGAAALYVGRRGQSESALSWTVIGVLLADPTMARSYGFALSCAAVLGIVLFSRPLGTWMESVMPKVLAEPLGMTVAAQSLTLPIQILMEPELSLASVPANLLVSPLVGFATMAGLAALLVAWASPTLGFLLAWTASCGTQVMERIAAWLASGRYAVIAWPADPSGGQTSGNLPGALLMLLAEAMLVAVILYGVRLTHRLSDPCPELPGKPFRPGPRTRIALWFAHTKTFLERDWRR
ncbi:ComEC/Rec2 family competence protein [Bifidobacterium simiiventris]|uniref:ComEC/Rec2 family competence protein n=1 Tax=Bifidobacterium simiiventris TaxID=2834434 RepID=UPI001C57C9AD|nr:ComEC/Rec2 family competence protein [Bifidobacterium simiiventris]MBW3077641.1 ComEC/Rec2 family competence protein [Bifidobacterium simiiventris]